MKSCIRTLCILAAMLFAAQAFAAPVKAEASLEIDAEAAILIDAASGEVVYEKNADQLYDAAGMGKLMTVLLTAEAIDSGAISLQDKVTISKNAASMGGMSGFLDYNGSYTVEELFKIMTMISANDAAVALAEYVSGSEEVFVSKMNEKAAELGLDGSFTSASGHKAQNQALTARDCAKIAAQAVKHPLIFEYSSIYIDKVIHSGGRETELVNPNRLVRFYEGCDGLATGSGGKGGYCGVFTAEKNGNRYIAVILGAPSSDARSQAGQKLLDHAFANYESVIVVEKGKGLAKDVPVENGRKSSVHGVAGEELSLLIQKGAADQVEKEVAIYENLTAPVKKGQQIGEMTVKLAGEVKAVIPIVAYETVEEASLLNCARDIWYDWLRR